MTFEITNETEIDLEIEYQKIIEDAIMASLDEEKCPYEAEVSVTITDDEGIHLKNLESLTTLRKREPLIQRQGN